MTLLNDASHRRFNPLTREWVLVSPHRTQRPWQGQTERAARPAEQRLRPRLLSLPGQPPRQRRDQPAPTRIRSFSPTTSRPCSGDAGEEAINESGLIVAEPERGVCKVVCFSPRHDLTLARMSVEEIEPVVKVWAEEYRALGALETSAGCRFSRTAAR